MNKEQGQDTNPGSLRPEPMALTGYAGALHNATRNNVLNTQCLPSIAPSAFHVYLTHNTSLRGKRYHCERTLKLRGWGIFPRPVSRWMLESDKNSH